MTRTLPSRLISFTATAAAIALAHTAIAQSGAEPNETASERVFTIGSSSAALVSGTSVKSGFSAEGGSCPELILENFTITGQTVAVPGFAANEECAVILNAPADHYPIEITKIRIGWSSVFGDQGQSLEDALRIYPNGLPNPGIPQYEVLGPVLTDGAINEFDLTTVGGSGSRIVNSGPFTVSLRIANTMNINSPAPNHDANGCQPGKNAVFAIPGGWQDACALGVSGDWVMSVSYRQVNCGQFTDCNNNGIDDAVEIANDPSLDCDGDGVLDSCQIADDPSLDCDGDGVLDSCQIAADPSLDSNGNGILDVCESTPCLADVTGDGVVNGADLATILANWGPCP